MRRSVEVGGLSIKIHALVEALGCATRLRITAGQHAHLRYAGERLEGFRAGYVVADRGYDAAWLVEQIAASGAEAVILSRKNLKGARAYDAALYRERNAVERWFGWVKRCRRVATRHEKTGRNDLSFVLFAATMHLLR